ncbi:MAG: aminotransferase class I/II-fold pyridoxal phosphate-dependent enzyme [Sedimentisphaeraceae bacterium JB056]
MVKKKFEDFVNTKNQDVFSKAFELNAYLQENPEKMLSGLGLKMQGPAAPNTVLLDDAEHEVIMLGSNSYLNLTTHPDVVAASKAACEKYGYGMGAVSLYAGITELHRELEIAIADFYSTEDAIVFPSGYGTNIGVISAICNHDDIIINDSANHSSIFDGSVLSGATLKIYLHRDMKKLEHVLSRIDRKGRGVLIITDGVFSMHGDLAPLDEIVSLAEKYDARVMVDDAHGIGIVGPGGRGTAAAFGVRDKIDLNIGMLSKAPGGLGGFCAAKKEIVDYLRLYARSYFFSTALPAPIVAGLLEVFKLLKANAAGRNQLWDNINYLKSRLIAAGFNTGESASGIIPIIVGDEVALAGFHRDLIDNGVYTNIVSYPALRRKESRVRLCVMSSLTTQQMNKALSVIMQAGKKWQIIK